MKNLMTHITIEESAQYKCFMSRNLIVNYLIYFVNFPCSCSFLVIIGFCSFTYYKHRNDNWSALILDARPTGNGQFFQLVLLCIKLLQGVVPLVYMAEFMQFLKLSQSEAQVCHQIIYAKLLHNVHSI